MLDKVEKILEIAMPLMVVLAVFIALGMAVICIMRSVFEEEPIYIPSYLIPSYLREELTDEQEISGCEKVRVAKNTSTETMWCESGDDTYKWDGENWLKIIE